MVKQSYFTSLRGLHNLYSASFYCDLIIKYVACSMHSETRKICTVLVGKVCGKRLHERPMYRWENNIQMDLKDIRCVCVLNLSFCSS
jgi:hypothetical protein